MKNYFKTLNAILTILIVVTSFPLSTISIARANHAESTVQDALDAQEIVSEAEDVKEEARSALTLAQNEVIRLQGLVTAAEQTLEAKEAILVTQTPGTPEYNNAEREAIDAGIALGLIRNEHFDAITERSDAEQKLKDAEKALKTARENAAKAERIAAQAEADDAVAAYYQQRGDEIGADVINTVDGTVDIGGVTAACLQAAATKALAAEITTKLAPLIGASTAEGATAGSAAGAGSLLSVPVSDIIVSTYVGRLQGTAFTHAAQKTVVEPFLDSLAYNTAQCALDQLTNNIVKWIKGGFDGSPAKYAIDTNQLFADYAGQVANDLARQIRSVAVCDFTPTFKNDLANATELSPHTRNGFTDQVSCPFGNDFISFSAQEFSQDIQNGGWRAFEASLGDRGNSFGVTLITNRELALRQQETNDQVKQKLSWSNGFADIVDTNDCTYPADIAERIASTNADEEPLTLENIAFYQKVYCKTTTPGKIVGDQLTKSLGVDMDRLGFVDNMNKIIAALIQEIADSATEGTFKQLNNVFGNEE